MANALDQDPLYIDTTVTDIPCPRLRAVKYVGAGAPTITDTTTGHTIWTTDETCFDEINVTVPAPYLIDITVPSGIVLIYLGSGPR